MPASSIAATSTTSACTAPVVWRGVLKADQLAPFTPDALARTLGEKPLEVAQYTARSPLQTAARTSTLAHFAADCRDKRGHRDTSTPYEQMLLLPTEVPALESLHLPLRPYTQQQQPPDETLLRASRLPWKYGNHYDCPDGYLLQLHNQRRVALTCQDNTDYKDFGKTPEELDATWLVTLSPGDLLFIPSQVSHAVDMETSDDLSQISIAASFGWERRHDRAACNAQFKRNFPRRTQALYRGAR